MNLCVQFLKGEKLKSFTFLRFYNGSGFSRIEVLSVSAIIALLLTGLVFYIDPVEKEAQRRDVIRLADLSSLTQAINSAYLENPIPATLCAQGLSADKPRKGFDGCKTDSASGSTASNGSGWISVDLTKTGISIKSLPKDPINGGSHVYTYASDGKNWEITTMMESNKYIYGSKQTTDNSSNPAVYKVGTDLSLLP